MNKKPGWDIDVKSCSHDQLVELLQQLEGSEHYEIQLAIRRELVDRLRARGFTDAQIVDRLIWGVGSRAMRNKIARVWAPALGMTMQEFKRIANGS